MCRSMLGHIKRDLRRRFVALTPGYDSPLADWETKALSPAGTSFKALGPLQFIAGALCDGDFYGGWHASIVECCTELNRRGACDDVAIAFEVPHLGMHGGDEVWLADLSII
ncbi:hypothetical protein M514_00007 [Trichuris suis]|uniref:Uncharacterized protein n=1 Tax=Trichuris suis TaxID=68888 RepID=A0A085NTQ9_9BILA|nr:hypothetical protein M513_00007 [Trichuris suis]KFD72855.1 hypothetical protein M514_00007 [Trichuris suis]